MTVEERNDAILSLLPMARRMARAATRFSRRAEFDDCFGDACVGAIRAVDSFDATHGVELKRYAKIVVAGAIINGLRRRDELSEGTRQTLRKAEGERLSLAQERGTMPSLVEMERRVAGLRNALVAEHRSATLSLDAPLTANETVACDWSSDPAQLAEVRERNRVVAAATRQLPDRLRRVVTQRFYAGRSAQSIAGDLSVTPQRVSQLQRVALDALRTQLEVAL